MIMATMRKILLRGEQSDGRLSAFATVAAPHTQGPFLHAHDFDEAFYVIDGEVTFQVEDELITVGAGDLVFAPRNVPHTFANQGDAPAHMVIICTPAGFERVFARRIADEAGEAPPEWALGPTPEVIRVGPRIGD
jgi:quercetin dioxygenase-like cupin family protein